MKNFVLLFICSTNNSSSYEEEENDGNDNDDNSSLHMTPSPIFQDAGDSSDDEELSECDDDASNFSNLSEDADDEDEDLDNDDEDNYADAEDEAVAEACADNEDEDLDNDDEDNYADAEDEADDNDEEEDDESDSSISSEESVDEDIELEKKQGHKIVVEWDHDLSHSRNSEHSGFDPGHDTDAVAEHSEPVLATKVSGSFSEECSDEDDSDSISAEAIKNVIEHPEEDASVMVSCLIYCLVTICELLNDFLFTDYVSHCFF